MSSSRLPQVAVLGVVLFFIFGVFLQLLNLVFSAWFVQVFVFFCIPWVFYRLARQAPSKALGLSATSPGKTVAGALLGVACYFAVVLPLMHWVSHVVPASWREAFDGRAILSGLDGIEWALMVGAIVLAAPFCEEVFFRGFIQPRLIRRWGAPLGLLATSVLFSLIHVDPVGFLARVALGMLFGWLAYASAHLWVSIAAHASYNFLVCLLFFYGSSEPSAAVSPLSQGVLFLWLVLGAAGMVVLLGCFGFSPPSTPWESRVSPQTPPVLLRSIFRPWLLAAAGSFLLLVAMDYRGIALNMFDTVVTPFPRAARNTPQFEEAMEKMKALRQEARKGQVELKKYFEFRQQLFWQLSSSALSSR
jgi:membrane protease YdiL (CAAX protease family)